MGQIRFAYVMLGYVFCSSICLAEVVLEEVQVVDSAEVQRARHESAIQKIVIGEEDIERYGDATVGDILRRLPGMTFTGPAGVAKDVRMRGLDKGYTTFLINGELPPTAAKERQLQVDRLPADMIERIEIIRSPSAAYEAGSVAGVVNIVLKSRADNLTRLRLASGKNGEMDVGDAIVQWSHKYDNLDVVMGLSHTVGAEAVIEDKKVFNVATGALTSRDYKPKPVKKTETLFTPRMTWRLGEDKFTLDPFLSDGTETKNENTVTTNASGAPTKQVFNFEDKTDQINRLSGRYDGVAQWGKWFVKGGMQQAITDKNKQGTEANGAGVISKRTTEVETVQEYLNYIGLGGDLNATKDQLVSLGVEYRDSKFDTSKRKTENGANTTAVKDSYRVNEEKLIVWAQDEWHFAKAHWLTPGVRVERTNRDAESGGTVAPGGNFMSSNPSLHYRWAVLSDTNLRAGLAKTFKLPKYDQLSPLVTTVVTNSASAPDTAGNPDLKPERSLGLDLALEQFFANKTGSFGVNVYRRQVQDYIGKQTRLEGARWVQRPYNLNEATFKGIELDTKVPLLRSAQHDVTLLANHAWMKGHAVNNGVGMDIKDLPPRVTNVGVDWLHHPTRWIAGFYANYRPTFTTTSLNDDGVTEKKTSEQATLLDLYVGKTFSPLAEVRLIAKNVYAVKKAERTVKYNAAGAVTNDEFKVEHSRPTIQLVFESRF